MFRCVLCKNKKRSRKYSEKGAWDHCKACHPGQSLHELMEVCPIGM
jgi:hypothetical protein